MTPDRPAVNVSRRRAPRTRAALAALATLALVACRGNAPPATPPTEDAARIACDRYAAAAIQSGDPANAADLSRQATECYTALRPAPGASR